MYLLKYNLAKKILTLRMVDAELKQLKMGEYTYARDEKTRKKIEKGLNENGH